jgi:ketosteroid isomerase-like protein
MLKMTAHGVAFAVATLFVFAGPAFAQKSGNVRADIEKANEAFAAAFAKGDAVAIAAMYSGDAQVFPPNSDVITGSAAIQKVWQGAMGMGVKSVKLQTTEVEAHGAMAHEVGNYTMLAADGKEIDRGKYLVIWKREGNAWKLHRDIWNTSMRPPAK